MFFVGLLVLFLSSGFVYLRACLHGGGGRGVGGGGAGSIDVVRGAGRVEVLVICLLRTPIFVWVTCGVSSCCSCLPVSFFLHLVSYFYMIGSWEKEEVQLLKLLAVCLIDNGRTYRIFAVSGGDDSA